MDSLLNVLESSPDDTSKVSLLNLIATEYRNSQLDLVEIYANQALELSNKLNYNPGKVRAYFNIGNMYYIGGDYPKTLDNYLAALRVLEEDNNLEGIANAQMGIGNVLHAQGDASKAIEYYEMALQSYEKIGDSLGIAGINNNLGIIYMDQEKLDLALECHQKSAAIKTRLGNWKGMSSSYGNIGAIYSRMGQLEKALEYQEKALEIRDKLNNVKGMAMSYNDIGEIRFQQGQYQDALRNQLKSLQKAREVDYREGIRGALLSISRTYAALKNFKLAYDYHIQFSNYSDSLFSLEKAKEIAGLVSVHEAEKKQQQIEILERDREILELTAQEQKAKIRKNKAELDRRKAEIDRRNTILASGGVIVILILVVLYIQYRKNKFKSRMNAQLRASNEEIALKNQVIEEKNRDITDSIEYAKTIQDGLLPDRDKFSRDFSDSFLLYLPKDIVSGDFYWREDVEVDGKTRRLIAVADCTGHGVAGAMVSILCHTALNRAVREFGLNSPGDILGKTRELIVREFERSKQDIRNGMDVSLISIEANSAAEFDVVFSGAFNPLWVINKSGRLDEYKGDNQSIGLSETYEPFSETNIQLTSDDTIYMFSDGFADQFGGAKGKKFKSSAFKDLLLSIQGLDMDAQESKVLEAFSSWMGDLEQLDDVTVLGIKL